MIDKGFAISCTLLDGIFQYFVYITPFRIALLDYLDPTKTIREKVIDSINPIHAGGKKAHYRFFSLTSTNVRIKPQNLF